MIIFFFIFPFVSYIVYDIAEPNGDPLHSSEKETNVWYDVVILEYTHTESNSHEYENSHHQPQPFPSNIAI